MAGSINASCPHVGYVVFICGFSPATSASLFWLSADFLIPEMLVKELDDQRFHCRILEKTDPAAAGIEPPGFWIGINSEVRIVTATNNRMEMVRCVYLVHRIGQ